MEAMSPEVTWLFAAMEKRRRKLAGLPFLEKVRAVVQLQRMIAPILGARGRQVRAWDIELSGRLGGKAMENPSTEGRRYQRNGPALAAVAFAFHVLSIPFAAEITSADMLHFKLLGEWANADAMEGKLGLYSVAQLTGNSATFVSDVTIPDGTVVNAGQRFTKTWRVKNSGSTSWNGYSLTFSGGDKMGTSTSVAVPTTTPGAMVDISVPMIAPTEPGPHRGDWRMRAADGAPFGEDVFVLITVKGTRPLAELETDLRDHSPEVRKKAVEALAALGPQAAPTLMQALKKDADAGVRGLAMAGLADIKPLSKEAFLGILTALNDPDDTVQLIAMEVLYAIGPGAVPTLVGPETVPTLARALTNPNPAAQSMAIQLLGVLGPAAKEAVPALRELVTRQPNNDLAKEALRVIEGH
ncbi:HEAT repeat protein [Candidatus Methylomirabilis lanthanidiphila]|uniref:HEAT repeat protein n=1 Tax=Candidatus Methylomirabilis lanthanidiphila TaxID=2211376 RepID=A0A564ZLH6_9BACT|nr:HEAT repeat protein [Candidatus Methylomirabilis lanthanidiphila]